MPDRTLSTSLTPFLKFAAAPGGVLLFGYGAYALWVRPEVLLDRGVPAAIVPFIQGFGTLVAGLGAAVVLRFLPRLKRVVLAQSGLRVSNYRSEVLVPFTAITEVRPSLPSSSLIHVGLRGDVGLESAFEFMATGGAPKSAGQEHPVVDDLRKRANLTPQ